MRKRFDFVFFNQVSSRGVFDLCARVARELGPTLLHTATEFPETPGALELKRAPQYDNSSKRSRLRTWTTYVIDALKVSASLRGRPVVMVSSNPPFGPFLGYALYRLRGWPYIARILDVYPDVIIQAGMAKPSHPLMRSWASLNRLALGSASRVITLGPVMVERVQRYLPRDSTIDYIPDWVDPSVITPRAKNENPFAIEHGQVGKLTVLYSGNLGLTHDLSALFKAAEMLEAEDGLRFMFIGGGARRHELETLAARLRNVIYLPSQPDETLAFSIPTGDVAVVTLSTGAEGVSMPSKTYYMMSAGCAILGISHGDNDLSRLIAEHRCGVNVDPSDLEGLRRALRRFASDRRFLEDCRRAARHVAETRFSADACQSAYIDLLRAVRMRERPA